MRRLGLILLALLAGCPTEDEGNEGLADASSGVGQTICDTVVPGYCLVPAGTFLAGPREDGIQTNCGAAVGQGPTLQEAYSLENAILPSWPKV